MFPSSFTSQAMFIYIYVICSQYVYLDMYAYMSPWWHLLVCVSMFIIILIQNFARKLWFSDHDAPY